MIVSKGVAIAAATSHILWAMKISICSTSSISSF